MRLGTSSAEYPRTDTRGVGGKPSRGRKLRAFVGLATCVGLLLAVAGPAWGARVTAPVRLRPGRTVIVHTAGFPPGSFIRVQLASFRARRYNCCVSTTYPSVRRAGIFVPASGEVAIRWRVPTEYAQCVASSCTSPDYKRFKPGEAVAVDVATEDDTAFAEARATVA